MEIATPTLPAPSGTGRHDALRQAATDLEAAFLAEMLKHTGVATPPDTFGGGAGEGQFASFLTREYAQAIAESGGIGLAEQLFQALLSGQDAP